MVFGEDDLSGAPDGVAPAVIGSSGGVESAAYDEVVYIPSGRFTPGDQTVSLVFRATEDGLTALPVYSSLELLVQACGEHQPWVSMPVSEIHEMRYRGEADVVWWNVELPDDQRDP